MPPTPIPAQAPAPVISSIPSLLTSGKWSDLLLECDNHSWQVHKFVLCTQSSFFTKACEGDTWEEAKNSKVTLPDDHSEAVDAVLQYLYTSSYQYKRSKTGTDRTVAPFFWTSSSSQRFCDRLVQRPSQMTEGTQLWKTPAFADAIRELYLNAADTDRQMHQAVVHVSAQYAKGLLTSSYGTDFRRVVDDVKTFGTEIHMAALLL
ncbi:hypothetical protein M409DRAFT_24324 [Zasmidium cellare ATCC 36951]|uniref:BTB domain-containing protein n=1 Tax=Zasmidium cellare ATCC 36951 TaxID=1080233 RepID=A0A6A6CE45_ZASCE|nr:uncharacterized protein M409DRAFT_24324 [Zasmidium cellare ATCC 36951]KAF2165474.1 hypothetical protein M409DRAFT_24324 [Zasmidium cellare ATCC 36951]